MKITQRSSTIKYVIRDIIKESDKLEKQGHKIIKLNIGDPNAYDFDTPEVIKEAFIQAVKKGYNGYSPSNGIEVLREAIVKREKKIHNLNLDIDKIIITSGVSEAILFLFGALIEKEDEVLVPGPTYPPYISYVKYFDGNPIEYKTTETNNWQPDIEDIKRKITSKTKALVIISPNNPTGAVYSQEILKEIIALLRKYNILLISDEIYDMLIFEKKHISPCSLAEGLPYVQLNGISKGYLAPGWRIGNINFSNMAEKLYQACMKQARIRLCASSPAQFAYTCALTTKDEYIKEVKEKLLKRRNFAYEKLNQIKGIKTTKPEGAFYLFPKIEIEKIKDDKKFVLEFLYKKQVLLVPGSGFGEKFGKSHFRVVFLPPEEILATAFEKLNEFIEEL